MRPPAVVAVLALAACSAEANYTLQLVPRVPLNQTPFADGPMVRVRLLEDDGNTSWSRLGSLSGGTVQDGGFGVLEGTRVGVALGGGDGGREPELAALTGWGESQPQDLALGREEVEVDVLVAETGGIGALGELDAAALGASVAVTSDGAVFLVGGAARTGGPCSPDILRLDSLDGGGWSFTPLDFGLAVGVCHAHVTTVRIDGEERVVISGGEEDHNAFDLMSNQVALLDPESGEIVWTGESTLYRSRGATRVLADGRVLWVSAGQRGPRPPDAAGWEIFDPESRTMGALGQVSSDGGQPRRAAPFGFMAAPSGPGLAICGGGEWRGNSITASATCLEISPDGSVSDLPDLPMALRDGAMVALDDGGLLVTGGITGETEAGPNQPATDAAYLLPADGGAWQDVGPLPAPLAFHRALPQAGGGAVLVGGAPEGFGYGLAPAEAQDCGYRWTPDGGFVPLDPCAVAGEGLLPSVGEGGPGAFLLAGRPGTGRGGLAFGVVALGPL